MSSAGFVRMPRTRRIARVLEAAAVAIAVVAMLLGPNGFDSLLLDTAANAMHGVVFVVIAIALASFIERAHSRARRSNVVRTTLVLGACAVIGVLVELAQPLLGRDAEIKDVINDLLGACIGVTVHMCVANRTRHVYRAAALGIVGPAIALAWPVGAAVQAYAARQNAFPVLFRAGDAALEYFTASRSASISLERLPTEWSRFENETAARVEFLEDEWTSFGIFEPQPDWSRHSKLMVDLTNPGDAALPLQLRVYDRAYDGSFEDQFNRVFELPPRARVTLALSLDEMRILPSGRTLKTGAISDVMIYARGYEVAGRQLYISEIRLEE